MAKKRITLPKNFKELLEKGDIDELKKVYDTCDANAKWGRYGSNAFEMTPLPREFAFWLKGQGADINRKDYYGKTPVFHHASYYNGDVRLLIELGADVNPEGDKSPLHLAAVYGRVEAVSALIENGADVNAKLTDIFHNDRKDTPLELALIQAGVPLETLLKVCEVLLENGAVITDKARNAVTEIGKRFEFGKGAVRDLDFLAQQTKALKQLYDIFGAVPAKEIEIHDGFSPIIISETGFANQYNKMWEYLVPPNGPAKTAQGEVIRIMGKVSYEILDNGGMNWDKDFKLMLDILPVYFKMGDSLPEEEMTEVNKLIKAVYHGNGNKEPGALTEYAVSWVMKNQAVISVIPPVYKR